MASHTELAIFQDAEPGTTVAAHDPRDAPPGVVRLMTTVVLEGNTPGLVGTICWTKDAPRVSTSGSIIGTYPRFPRLPGSVTDGPLSSRYSVVCQSASEADLAYFMQQCLGQLQVWELSFLRALYDRPQHFHRLAEQTRDPVEFLHGPFLGGFHDLQATRQNFHFLVDLVQRA